MGKLLAILDASDLLDHRTSSDDAERSKPDPDIVGAALERAHASPSEALMIGDTPYDVEAAGRCQVPTIALLCGGWSRDRLSGACAVYEDPADLLAHFSTSPFAQ